MVTSITPRTDFVFLLLCFLELLNFQAVAGNFESEIESHAVKIKIYDTKVDEWDNGALKDITAEYASYCNSQLSQCGLISATSFNSSNVGVASPAKVGYSIVTNVYILFPAGAAVDPNGTTTFAVPYDATKEILASLRDAYHDQSGLWITDIGNDYYSIPPDAHVNEVVIPLAVMVVVMSGLLAAFLNYYEKRKEKSDKLKKRMDEKKKGGSTSLHTVPNYNNILETTNTTIVSTTPRISSATNNNSNNPSKVHPENRNNYVSWKTMEMSHEIEAATPTYTRPSVNEFHTPEISVKKNGLKPLESGEEHHVEETEAEKKERRRRRKERRREKRRLKELEMQENHGQDSSNMSENDVDRSKSDIHTFSVVRGSET